MCAQNCRQPSTAAEGNNVPMPNRLSPSLILLKSSCIPATDREWHGHQKKKRQRMVSAKTLRTPSLPTPHSPVALHCTRLPSRGIRQCSLHQHARWATAARQACRNPPASMLNRLLCRGLARPPPTISPIPGPAAPSTLPPPEKKKLTRHSILHPPPPPLSPVPLPAPTNEPETSSQRYAAAPPRSPGATPWTAGTEAGG